MSANGVTEVVTNAKKCMEIFESLVSAARSTVSNSEAISLVPLSQALTTIYSESAKMLKSLVNDNSFRSYPPSSESRPSAQLPLLSSAREMVVELAVFTSYLFASFVDESKKLKSPSCVAVALAPYWAISVFVTQIGGANYLAVKEQVLSALASLLTNKAALLGTLNVAEDALRAWGLVKFPLDLVSLPMPFAEVFARSCLSSPLQYAVQLVLAMRKALELKIVGNSLPTDFAHSILTLSDSNSLKLIQTLIQHCPQLAMVGELTKARALPISYIASSASSLFSSAMGLSQAMKAKDVHERLYVHLALLFCKFVPSSLSTPDADYRVALHYACTSKNPAPILSIILSKLPCTASLVDIEGHYPLHHLVQNDSDDGLVLVLAKTFPAAAKECLRLLKPSKLKQSLKEVCTRNDSMIMKGDFHLQTPETDNESLSNTSQSTSSSSTPDSPLVDSQCDQESEGVQILQYAASLLMLKSSDSSNAAAAILPGKKRQYSVEESTVQLTKKRARAIKL